MSAPDAAAVFGADEQRDVPVDVARSIRLARMVLAAERVPPDVELAVLFVDERAMSDLHARFLGGEGPTDVLAFPLDDELVDAGRQPDQGGSGPASIVDDDDDRPVILGDVVVCPSVAARQARDHGRSVDDELALLVVHGTLHLLRYDHAAPGETERMRHREQELLARFRSLEEGA